MARSTIHTCEMYTIWIWLVILTVTWGNRPLLKKKTFNHEITDNMDVRVTGIGGLIQHQKEIERLGYLPLHNAKTW